jgi:hypothetical protein
MSQWFLSRQGKTVGPYSLDQLKGFASAGHLQPDDLIWVEQAKKWVPAKSVKGLYGAGGSGTAQAVMTPPRPAGGNHTPAAAVMQPPPGSPPITRPMPGMMAPTPQVPSPAGPPRQEPGFFRALRKLPKPILFGLFGALGGLAGALLFGEILWRLLAPVPPEVKAPEPLRIALSKELQIYNGDTEKFTVKIDRHDWDGPVTLELKDPPANVTAPTVTIEPGKTEAEVAVQVHRNFKDFSGAKTIVFQAKGNDGKAKASGELKLDVREAPPPLVRVSVPDKVEIYPGTKNSFEVKIVRQAFKGDVEVKAKNPPPGVEIAPITLKDEKDAIMADVVVQRSVKPGVLEFDLEARGTKENADLSDTVKCQVHVKPTPPYFALGLPKEVKLYQNGKAQFTIKIGRFPVDSPVQLELVDLPAGVTAPKVLEVAPNKEEVTAVLSADKRAATGKMDITVKGLVNQPDGKKAEAKFSLELLPQPPPEVDVLFVLDLTSSMHIPIKGIKEGMQKFAADLQNQKIDMRVGMLGFRDIQDDAGRKDGPFVVFVNGEVLNFDDEPFRNFVKLVRTNKTDIFTKNYAQFGNMVGKLKDVGGGDIPESSMPALVLSTQQLFRQDASRVLILITDAPPKLMHFGVTTESVEDAAKAMTKTQVAQFHLVVKDKDRAEHYQPLLNAMNVDPKQKKGFFHDFNKVAKNVDAFAALLPEMGKEIEKITAASAPELKQADVVKAPPPPAAKELQQAEAKPPAPAAEQAKLGAPPKPPDFDTQAITSREKYTKDQMPQLLLAIAIWTAVVAAAISLWLISGQHFYMKRAWMNTPDFGKGFGGGLLAGVIGGVIGQLFFQLSPGGTTWEVITRTLGWSLLGGLVGAAMSLIVPNLKWHRGLLGGLIGGVFGGLAFIGIASLTGDLSGRLLGATIVGFFIGVMIALAEMVFRRFWLELVFSAREIRTVTLGAAPVGIGGDERLASVFIQGAAPLALRYRVDGKRVLVQDMATGQVAEIQPGDRRQVGNVAISLCSPSTTRTLGLVLQLSNGKNVALNEGMPLTADDIPGLQPQAADGAVALISRRPNDPKTLLLRNRSSQTWAAFDPRGVQSTVEPGRAIELTPNLMLNFGQLQGRLLQQS